MAGVLGLLEQVSLQAVRDGWTQYEATERWQPQGGRNQSLDCERPIWMPSISS